MPRKITGLIWGHYEKYSLQGHAHGHLHSWKQFGGQGSDGGLRVPSKELHHHACDQNNTNL